MNLLNNLFAKLRIFGFRLGRVEWKISLLLSLWLFLFAMISVFATVSAQSDEIPGGKIDVPAIWEESHNNVVVVTADPNTSIQHLENNDTTSMLLNKTVMVAGTDVILNADENARKFGIERYGREGLLTRADRGVRMAMIGPQVNIPDHLARQWVPGYDGPGTEQRIYAADIDGYTFLQQYVGLEPIWEMSRNIAYAGFVITIIVSGFMIMFRQKIGGQTSVNIMNTIPSVLIGLIVVTFSFAIVGFIIDIGRLLVLSLDRYMNASLSSAGFRTVPLGGPWQMFTDAFFHGGGVMGGKYDDFNVWQMIIKYNVEMIIDLLIYLILLGAGLYACVKVFVTLLMCYFKLFIEVVLGPIKILLGSLPGRSHLILDWIKRVASNVLVFPLVFLIINLSRYILFGDVSTQLVSPLEYMSGGEGFDVKTGGIEIRGVFMIVGYFFAAGAPSLVEGLMDLKPGAGAQMGQSAQKAMSKIPLVGGLAGG